MIIETYCSSSGTYYVKEFMSELPPKAVKKVIGRLELIEKYGTFAGSMKKLHGYDIYEIVIDFNRVFYRILCVIRNSVCWLLHMFKKKSNSTPVKEILIALQRAKDLDLQLSLALN